MKKETNLCMSCMSEKPEPALSVSGAECPLCGWSDKGVYLTPYLYPKTFLAGRYIVGKLISYNGEAALYMGYDTLTQSKVTVKEYMPDALGTRERDVLQLTVNPGSLPLYKTYLSEFIELNRSLQSLGTGAGIQKVLDVFSENNTAYSIHEYITGISLKAYLQNSGSPLSWEQVKELFPPIFTALGIANSAGIVHRGVNPLTVFVNEKQEIKLIGFAISAARTYGSELNYEVFSGYTAPEQYNMSERQGSWTDIYGLSALLYNTLTGITPPAAPDRQLSDTLAEPRLVNRNIPVNISDAIMRGLELNPEKRVKTVSGFVERLFSTINSRELAKLRVLSEPNAVKPDDKPINGDISDDVQSSVIVVPNKTPQSSKKRADARKKTEKERKRKVKYIVVTSLIASVVLFFAILIPLSIGNPEWFSNIFSSDETEEPPQTSATTPRYVEIPDTTAPEEDLYEMPSFVDRKYNAGLEESYYIAGEWLIKFDVVEEYSEVHEKGKIFYQSVDAGEEVPYGTEVTIKVSKGSEFVELPDYEDLTVDEYIKELSKKGILTYEVEDKESKSVDKGYVVKCNIKVGGKVSIGDNPDTVIIYRAVKPSSSNEDDDD